MRGGKIKPVRMQDYYGKNRRIMRFLNIAFGLTIAAILIVIGYGFYEYKIWEYFK